MGAEIVDPADLRRTANTTPSRTSCCSTSSYPHITVPAGFVHGLLVGISFFGAAWSEPVLLKLAYGFEKIRKGHKPPRLLRTLEF
jgi:amidase